MEFGVVVDLFDMIQIFFEWWKRKFCLPTILVPQLQSNDEEKTFLTHFSTKHFHAIENQLNPNP